MARCLIVQQLIDALSVLPPGLPIISDGADCGGYDITYTVGVEVNVVDNITVEGNRDFEPFAKAFPRGVCRLQGTEKAVWDEIEGGS